MARFDPYILSGQTHEHIPVSISEMTPAEAASTNQLPLWQTDWTSDFISNPSYLKYAVRTKEGTLVALGAYEILESALIVHIAYLESHPDSNPTLQKGLLRYRGIGRVLMAFGIKLSIDHDFGGDIMFEAKTPELARHYEHDFGALPLPAFDADEPPRYLIAGESAKRIFLSYLV